MTQVVRVTDESTRADIEEALSYLNQGAKVLSRKGYTGIASEAYTVQHARINAVLDDWCAAGPNCRTCGRTKASCDAEPRHCCEVCDANGHGG